MIDKYLPLINVVRSSYSIFHPIVMLLQCNKLATQNVDYVYYPNSPTLKYGKTGLELPYSITL